MHRIQIMERREEELKRQVTEKSHHITQLTERIAVSYYFSWGPFTLSVGINAAITLAIMLWLKTMELVQNGLQPNFGANPLFSMGALSLASFQGWHWRSV